MGRAKQYCLFLSVLVIYVFLKREKNLTLKTCAPAFPARSMAKLYAKIKGARAISLFGFPKTWQVWTILILLNAPGGVAFYKGGGGEEPGV